MKFGYMETPRIGGCEHGPEIMVYPDEVRYAGMYRRRHP